MLTGYSISAIRTAFYIDGLRLMLDCGLPHNKTPNYIAITHGHSDHFYEVGHGIAERFTVICPREIKPRLQSFLDTVQDLNETTHRIEKDIIIGLSKNDSMPLNENYMLETFECFHTIPTIGYGVYQKVKRLKPEFHGLSKKEIVAIKESGIELTTDEKKYILCYLCDTNINVFQDTRIFLYPTIMIECTFLGPDTIERANERFHINWLQLEPVVQKHPDNDFILFHWSNMYKPHEIKEYFKEYLEIYKNLKIWI
jgi:ribonuclease Z